MSFTTPALDPTDGLKNTTAYIARPANETDARAQVQGVIDQVVVLLQTLIDELEETTGTSGAENVGSKTITGVTGTTVYAQIANLKSQIDSVSAAGLSAGVIDSSTYFGAGVVVGTAIANDAVDTQHIADGAVETAQIADDAVTGDKIAAGAVDGSSLSTGSVTATQLASGSVTTVKILDKNVTTDKINDYSVTPIKLAALNVIPLDTGDYLTYNQTTNEINLYVSGCTAVPLAPILYGTSATPPSGTYPKGTMYLQYEA